MLKDFKNEWDEVWTLARGLKAGVVVKSIEPDIPAQVSALKKTVTTYQQFVASYNAAKDSTAQAPFAEKIDATFKEIQSQQAMLNDALTAQIQGNKTAPKGALQMPDNNPAVLYSPKLEELGEKIHMRVMAMEADLTLVNPVGDTSASPDGESEDNTEVQEEQQEPEAEQMGVSIDANVSAVTTTAPSWYKPKT